MTEELKTLDPNATAFSQAIAVGQRIETAEQEAHSYEEANAATGAPFLVLPPDRQIKPLPKECQPTRKAFNIRFDNISDFASFCGEYKDARTRLFMDEHRIVAIFDFQRPDNAEQSVERCLQRAELPLAPDDMTAAWLAVIGKKSFQQFEFAEFLEDQAINIVDPCAASILEVARTLEATQKVVFKSSGRLDNGDRQLKWEQSTDARAGANGDLAIPAKITVKLMLVKGGDRIDVTLGLRYRVKDGAVTFSLVAFGFDLTIQSYLEGIAERITQATSLPVYRGAALNVF